MSKLNITTIIHSIQILWDYRSKRESLISDQLGTIKLMNLFQATITPLTASSDSKILSLTEASLSLPIEAKEELSTTKDNFK